MTYAEFVLAVNTQWWGEHPPTEAPRHIVALYVAGYHAGLSPEQFLKFMEARNFVSTVTGALKRDAVPFRKGEDLLSLWVAGAEPAQALPRLFQPSEVEERHRVLFERREPDGA